MSFLYWHSTSWHVRILKLSGVLSPVVGENLAHRCWYPLHAASERNNRTISTMNIEYFDSVIWKYKIYSSSTIYNLTRKIACTPRSPRSHLHGFILVRALWELGQVLALRALIVLACTRTHTKGNTTFTLDDYCCTSTHSWTEQDLNIENIDWPKSFLKAVYNFFF